MRVQSRIGGGENVDMNENVACVCLRLKASISVLTECDLTLVLYLSRHSVGEVGDGSVITRGGGCHSF